MKKTPILILSMILLLCMSVSCASSPANPTDSTPSSVTTSQATGSNIETTSASTSATTSSATVIEPPVVAPADERSETRVFTSESPDGIKLEIMVHGYSSEKLGRDFYIKSNEFSRVDVKVTNTSDSSFYQHLPTSCREGIYKHNHEIEFSFSDGNGHGLHSTDSYAKGCPAMIDCWEIKSGESYTWELYIAAGETTDLKDKIDLPDKDYSWIGIALYDRSVYTDGACDFSGAFSFAYDPVQKEASTKNDKSVSVPVTLTVIYITK